MTGCAFKTRWTATRIGIDFINASSAILASMHLTIVLVNFTIIAFEAGNTVAGIAGIVVYHHIGFAIIASTVNVFGNIIPKAEVISMK